MFLLLLAVVLIAAAVHVVRMPDRTTERASELVMRYLLVGYCGIPMVVVALLVLLHPHEAAEYLGFAEGSPFQAFMGWAYLGLSLSAALALVYRGMYLIGPAIGWIVFFAGATAIHLETGHHGSMSHAYVLHVLGTHGLISVLLATALVMSGLLRRRG